MNRSALLSSQNIPWRVPLFPKPACGGEAESEQGFLSGRRVKGLEEGMEEGAASSHKRLQRALASPNWLHTAQESRARAPAPPLPCSQGHSFSPFLPGALGGQGMHGTPLPCNPVPCHPRRELWERVPPPATATAGSGQWRPSPTCLSGCSRIWDSEWPPWFLSWKEI